MVLALFLTVVAITPDRPQKNAISISKTCGFVLLRSSQVSDFIGVIK